MKTLEEKITRMKEMEKEQDTIDRSGPSWKQWLNDFCNLCDEVQEELYLLGDIERLKKVFDLMTCPKCQGEGEVEVEIGERYDGLLYTEDRECDFCWNGFIPRGEYKDENGDWIE